MLASGFCLSGALPPATAVLQTPAVQALSCGSRQLARCGYSALLISCHKADAHGVIQFGQE